MDMSEAIFASACDNEAHGDLVSAEIMYRGLLAEQPQHQAAAARLGLLLCRCGRPAEALAWLQLAVARPSVPLFASLGQAQVAVGDSAAALSSTLIASLLQGLSLAPLDAPVWLQLGLALDQGGHAAGAAFRAALLVQPGLAEACNNLGTTSRGPAAVAALRRAVQLVPDRADFHANLAHALLSVGDFAAGFAEWEWRTLSPPRSFDAPKWQGEPLSGRTLLVHAEQGYGDSIQFSRYLPLLAASGGRVVVETRAPLAGLLGRLPGVDAVTLWGEPWPPVDLQIALPSLAARFPFRAGAMPYLKVDSARATRWRQRLAERAPRRPGQRRVGLVWAGNPRGLDPRRAMAPALLQDLVAQHGDCRFIALQRETTARLDGVLDLGALIEDFDDLAAALTELDLLISVDTAAAHLAGALGRPLWVLLHHGADWRWWGAEQQSSAWYASARVYRQAQPGDWPALLRQVGADLTTRD